MTMRRASRKNGTNGDAIPARSLAALCAFGVLLGCSRSDQPRSAAPSDSAAATAIGPSGSAVADTYVEYRFEQAPGDSSGRAYSLPGSAGSIVLANAPVIDLKQVASAVLLPDSDGRYMVGARLTPDGQRAMTSATTAAAGRRMAVLVDGRIVTVATLSSPLTSSSVPLLTDASNDEAIRLAATINSRTEQ